MTLPRDLYAKVAAVLGNCDGVRVAFLFGSTVVGGTWTQSDLDIAVGWEIGFDDERRLDAQLELIDALTGALGQLGEQADLVDIDRASSAVAFRAISEGVCVFASSESERVDAIVNTCRRYDDDAPGRVRFQRAALAAVERMKVGVHG
jgi:predicted nucleotidyltransferase